MIKLTLFFKYYNYTYYLLFTSSSYCPVTYTFYTMNTTGSCDPVMYIFEYSTTSGDFPNPNKSWSDDNSGPGNNPMIEDLYLADNNLYCLMLRDNSGNYPGTSDLKIEYYVHCQSSEGYTIFEDVPVAGKKVNASSINRYGVMNYFTCKLWSGDDTHIFMPQTSSTSKIMAYDCDYNGDGNWDWGNSSRIKGTFSPYQDYILLSSESSYDPWGLCDVYLGCYNSTITDYFPNLTPDDAIRSAPTSGVYNCISWTGGIYWDWFWPPTDYPLGWWAENDTVSFDNFYSYDRYDNCYKYTRIHL